MPVLTDAQLAVLDEASNLVREHAANACHRAEAAVKEIGEQVARMTSLLNEVRAAARTPAPTKPSVMRAEQPRRKPATPVPSGGETTRLGKAPRLILTALAQHGIRTAKQVALLTAYSHKSGGYRNALSELRTSGFIEGSGTTGMSITAEGLEALGDIEPLPTGEALLDWWKDNHLGKAERAIVEVLAEDYPSPVPVTDIAERAGYSAASGGYRNALSRLRSLGIAYNDSPGILVLSPEFFD